MKQADALVKRHAFSEAEQLYSRVNDIVASFSPANGPMIDVINRKYAEEEPMRCRRLELDFYANTPKYTEKLLKTMKTMRANVDSRGDKEEAVIERAAFATIALHCGKTEESGSYCKEVGCDLFLFISLFRFARD